MVLLTLGKHIMTIKKVKGPILVHMLFWGQLKKFPREELLDGKVQHPERLQAAEVSEERRSSHLGKVLSSAAIIVL